MAARGVGQRYTAPERIFVRTCGTPCRKFGVPLSETDPRGEVSWWEWWPWQEPGWTLLGMIPLPLDDGHSSSGRYRYGDLSVAAPLGNPGLAADREHLLALRDALSGTAVLNWTADSYTAQWEGVTLAGTPPRVTGLDLSNHGLTGSIWGWLADLSELAELRLDRNRLTGTLPSKLATLTKLTHLYLAGNELEGCVPPPLRLVPHHDLDQAGLPDCASPTVLTDRWGETLTLHTQLDILGTGGTFRWDTRAVGPSAVFDLPSSLKTRITTLRPLYEDDGSLEGPCPPCYESVFESSRGGVLVAPGNNEDLDGRPSVWLLLHMDRVYELERSHFVDEDPSSFALLEQIAASVWVNTAGQVRETEWGTRIRWTWP